MILKSIIKAIFFKQYDRNEKVCFSYDDSERVLDKVDISVDEGKMAAIVGAVWGKSTLIKLLMGFYNVDDGEIFMDGKPIESRSLRELEMISYVPQDAYLFMELLKKI